MILVKLKPLLQTTSQADVNQDKCFVFPRDLQLYKNLFYCKDLITLFRVIISDSYFLQQFIFPTLANGFNRFVRNAGSVN